MPYQDLANETSVLVPPINTLTARRARKRNTTISALTASSPSAATGSGSVVGANQTIATRSPIIALYPQVTSETDLPSTVARITNIRADVSGVGPSSTSIPAQIAS